MKRNPTWEVECAYVLRLRGFRPSDMHKECQPADDMMSASYGLSDVEEDSSWSEVVKAIQGMFYLFSAKLEVSSQCSGYLSILMLLTPVAEVTP